jgi:hypothetical protein
VANEHAKAIILAGAKPDTAILKRFFRLRPDGIEPPDGVVVDLENTGKIGFGRGADIHSGLHLYHR